MATEKKSNPIVDEYLKKGLHKTKSQYVDDAVWAAARDAVENKKTSGFRKQVEEAIEPTLLEEAYSWKYSQPNNSL